MSRALHIRSSSNECGRICQRRDHHVLRHIRQHVLAIDAQSPLFQRRPRADEHRMLPCRGGRRPASFDGPPAPTMGAPKRGEPGIERQRTQRRTRGSDCLNHHKPSSRSPELSSPKLKQRLAQPVASDPRKHSRAVSRETKNNV